MAKFTEKSIVEDYFIEKLKEKGWNFIPADDLHRESYEEPLLTSNLVRSLKSLNEDIDIGEEEIKHVLNEQTIVIDVDKIRLKEPGIQHVLYCAKTK